jgi:ketosteroid isomerase-like protein
MPACWRKTNDEASTFRLGVAADFRQGAKLEANVNATEANNIEVVRRYFAGCQTGDLDTISSTLDADVVHYFLPSRFPPIKGAGPLAKYWRAYKLALNPVWSVDHVVARDDEVVSEWSCIWTPKRTDKRLMLRGSEWYVMRAGKIAEIRAYFMSDADLSCELAGFPYAERGYLGFVDDPAKAASTVRRAG